MRKLPLGVAISTGVHAVAIVFAGARLAGQPRPEVRRPSTEIEIVDVQKPPAPDEPPVEVALVDEATSPAVAPVAVAPPVPSRPQRPEISTGRPPGPEVAPPGAGSASAPSETPGPPPTRSALSMRSDKPDLRLPAGQWDSLEHAPRGTTPEPEIRSPLLRSKFGRLEGNQGTFTGKVNDDGTVALEDSRNLSVHVALPSVHDIGNGLSAWYNGDKTPGAGGDGGSAPLAKHFQASSGATTNLGDRTQPNSNDQNPTVVVPIIGGNFDTTDWLMRRHGEDPYASKKLKFLDATRDARAQVGQRFRDQQLGRAGRLMTQSLEELRKSKASLAERKQALFELWDDCIETGETRETNSGSDARRLVLSFIQLHLPAGSPSAYTEAELAALARRKQSKAAFRPYDP